MKPFVTLIFLSFIFTSNTVQAKRNKQYFNQSEFEVDFSITHPILAADFIKAADNELFLLGEQEDKQKIVALYALDQQDNQYKQHIKILLPKNIIAFDLITDVKGLEKILLLYSGGLSVLNLENGLITPLIKTDSIYLDLKPQFVAKKELVRDLNNDGLDDIFISDFENINVYIQQNDGEFIKSSLPIKPLVNMTNEDIAFSEKQIFNVDTNFDQLVDIVILVENKLHIFEQLKSGEFNQIIKDISLPMQVSDIPWWMLRGADGESVDQSQLQHRMLEAVEDINGDSIPDIMVRLTNSSGVFDRQNIYEIYYGSKREYRLGFGSKSDTSISAEGTLSGLELLDINADGRQEILVSSFDIGISQIIGALLSGSVDQDVYVFSLDEKNQYTKEPLFSEEVDLNFSFSSGSTGKPVILLVDLNGDKLKELMLSSSSNRLAIYSGENTKQLFRSRYKKHKIRLPEDGSMMIAADLNSDSKQEIVVRYGKQDPKELQNKIVILSSK